MPKEKKKTSTKKMILVSEKNRYEREIQDLWLCVLGFCLYLNQCFTVMEEYLFSYPVKLAISNYIYSITFIPIECKCFFKKS